MTVVNNNARNQYIASNGQTIFDYTFEITDPTFIKVYLTPNGNPPNDIADLLTYTTDYTVTAVSNPFGGTIILNAGASAGDRITLMGNPPAQRTTTFSSGGVIKSGNLNTEFDYEVLIYQRLLAVLNDLTPKYAESALVNPAGLVLPNLTPNTIWQMNGAGTAIVASLIVSAADLSSNAAGQGASLIGLHPTGTVQDLANSTFILQTANAAAPNAQSLGALGSGVLVTTTGTGILSISTPLTSINALTTAADLMIYTTASNVYATTALTALARSLLADPAVSDMLTTLNVTPYSQTLLPLSTAAAWRSALGVSTGGSALQVINNLSDVASIPASVANLGLTIGVDTQAYSAVLDTVTAGTYVGSSSIITLGTITTGVWHGTNVDLAHGGTNANLTASNGGIIYSTATAMAVLAGVATAGRIVQSGATAAPTWSTATYPSAATGTGTLMRANGTNWVASTLTIPDTYVINTIPYASAANVLGAISAVNNAVLVSSAGGVPSMSTTLPSGLTAATMKLAQLIDANGNIMLQTAVAASAVNYLTLQNAATGNVPGLFAAGADTNISASIGGKGTSGVNIFCFADGSNGVAGSMGEYASVTVDSSPGVSLTSGVAKTIGQFTLGAGDWDFLGGYIIFSPGGANVISSYVAALNTTTNTLPSLTNGTGLATVLNAPFTTGSANIIPIPAGRLTITTTTTYYIVGYSAWTTSTMVAGGYAAARRRR